MTTAQLTITLPDGTWIKDVSTDYPDALFRVLAAIPGEEAGFGLIEITSGHLPKILKAMDDHPVIVALKPLRTSDDRVIVQAETSAPLLMRSAMKSRMPLSLPIDIQNGLTTLDITASREHISELATQFENAGISFDVEYVREGSEPDLILSERQQQVLLAAVKYGYYDTPRRCSLTELSETLDIAKSTCSETLHRAEESIIKEFVDELPVPTSRDTME